MSAQVKVTNAQVSKAADELALVIRRATCGRMRDNPGRRLYGVPRGGVPAAWAIACHLDLATVVDDPIHADFIIDDLIDSGRTMERYAREYPGVPFLALFDKRNSETKNWMIFPWEDTPEASGRDIPVRLLQYIGEDANREGLRETPKRFLKAWRDYTSGYDHDPSEVLKTFQDGAEKVDEMVVIKDIPVYSHCEHHLAPFFGVAHIGYIPNGKVLGLSKFARLVDIFSKRLQVQERLTQQIAHALNDGLQPKGVGVILQCRHMCMEARGVRTQSQTGTSCLLGAMKDLPSARAEFLGLRA